MLILKWQTYTRAPFRAENHCQCHPSGYCFGVVFTLETFCFHLRNKVFPPMKQNVSNPYVITKQPYFQIDGTDFLSYYAQIYAFGVGFQYRIWQTYIT